MKYLRSIFLPKMKNRWFLMLMLFCFTMTASASSQSESGEVLEQKESEASGREGGWGEPEGDIVRSYSGFISVARHRHWRSSADYSSPHDILFFTFRLPCLLLFAI